MYTQKPNGYVSKRKGCDKSATLTVSVTVTASKCNYAAASCHGRCACDDMMLEWRVIECLKTCEYVFQGRA